MAPEALLGMGLDTSADVWSMGIMVRILATVATDVLADLGTIFP